MQRRKWAALERLVPGYVRQVRSDLYWADFADGRWKDRSAAAVFGRQVLMTAMVGLAAYFGLGSSVAFAGGFFIGWSLARSDLRGRADTVWLRIAQELPEFVQLMPAESASGAGLDAVLRHAAGGTGTVATWLRSVLDACSGKPLIGGIGASNLSDTGPSRYTSQQVWQGEVQGQTCTNSGGWRYIVERIYACDTPGGPWKDEYPNYYYPCSAATNGNKVYATTCQYPIWSHSWGCKSVHLIRMLPIKVIPAIARIADATLHVQRRLKKVKGKQSKQNARSCRDGSEICRRVL